MIELKTHSVSTTSAGDKGRLLALLKGGVVDQMMFCSVDDVHSIRVLVSPELLISLFAHIEVKAIDDVTSQALHEIGLNPTMIRK